MILTLFATLLVQFNIIQAREELANTFTSMVNVHNDICLQGYSDCKSDLEKAGNLPPELRFRSPRNTADLSGPGVCCGYCRCYPNCATYGSCCLSKYESFEHGRIAIESSRYGCVKPEFLTTKRTKTAEPVWMVTKCAENWQNDTVKKNCEHPGKDGIFNTMVPVTHVYQHIHYRNKYCAICNDMKNPVHLSNWMLEFNCQSMLKLPDKDVMISMKDKKCNIVYKLPDNIPGQECKVTPFTISRCNVTGQWRNYDRMVERGCRSLIDPFNLTYMNYFCYLCNTAEKLPYEELRCKAPSHDIIQDITPPFSALMDLDAINSMLQDKHLDCNTDTQFEDYKMKLCRDIFCHEDRHMDRDKCVIDMPQTNNQCYSVFIKLKPFDAESSLPFNLVHQTYFHPTVEHLFRQSVPEFDETVSKFEILYKPNIRYPSHIVDYLIVSMHLSPNINNETDTLNVFVDNIHQRMKTIDVGEMRMPLYTELAFVNKTGKKDSISTGSLNVAADDLISIYTIPDKENKTNTCFDKDVIPVRKPHICPYLKINFRDLPLKIENGVLLTSESTSYQFTFSEWEYEQMDDYLLICLKDYIFIYDAIPEYHMQREKNTYYVHPKQILALVCVCLSIGCLLVTIATYIMLYDLQSQPGINNVILCVFLVIAQGFYQFGAGQNSLSNWTCALIGALCHFLWLAVMFSMNICCIQMFRVFRKPTKLSPRFEFKNTLTYLLYVIILSLLFVGINLIVSLGTSNGSETGYGGTICFISSSFLHLITFIVPSAIVISANIVLFAYVVFTLNRTSANSMKVSQERNYFKAYARLSSLTGLTWIFGYLLILLQNEILEYLFIICNASQGVLIMVAFVFNHRTYVMLCKSKRLSRTSAQGTEVFTDK